MKVTPVIQAAMPRYPTQAALQAHPELLRALPGRWRRHALIASGLAGCCSLLLLQAQRADADPVSRVAPLFHHGAGNTRSFYGTSFGSLPVFLPEDEARQVIAEEMKQFEITFTPDSPTIEGLTIRVSRLVRSRERPVTVSLTLDGEDRQRRIAYEYYGLGDALQLGLDGTGTLVEQADGLRQALVRAHTEGTQVVFYDPAVRLTESDNRGGLDTPGMAACRAFSDRTLAPLGFFQHLAQKMDAVNWKGNTLTLSLPPHTLVFTVGSAEAQFDGQPVTLPKPVEFQYGVICLPLRRTAEALGFLVKYDEKGEIVSYGRRLRHPEDMPQPGRETIDWVSSRLFCPEGADPQTTPTYAYVAWDTAFREAITREQSKALLRLQVRDFLAWLKAQDAM